MSIKLNLNPRSSPARVAGLKNPVILCRMAKRQNLARTLALICLFGTITLQAGCANLRRPAAAAAPGKSNPAVGTQLQAAASEPVKSNTSAAPEAATQFPFTFKDAKGIAVTLPNQPTRVVAAEGSFAEVWQLAGGQLTGVPNDMETAGRMTITDSMTLIGSIKEPNAEIILSLRPDFVILSKDIEGHAKLADILNQNGIPHAFFKVEYFNDYLQMLKTFTQLTNCPEKFETNGEAVLAKVQAILTTISGQPSPEVLLIRAFAKGAKARDADNATGAMLKELGTINIAEKYPSLLEDMSLEQVISEDPDFIFITTMGSAEQAMAYLENGIMANPAWQGLKAVRDQRVVVLPKDLFQYKPNARWDEAYDYLAQILYPEAKS